MGLCRSLKILKDPAKIFTRVVPYAEDPLADSARTAEYEKEIKENEELEKELKHRLEGRVEVDVWYVSVFCL